MKPDLEVMVPEERLPEFLEELRKLTAEMAPPIPLESTPLHEILGAALLSQFMLMGLYREADVAIYHCKHVATRRVLYIGDDLRAWNYDPDTERFHHISLSNALAWAMDGSEQLGLLPGDDVDAWRARQQGEAAARGQRVIVCTPGQGIVTDTGPAQGQ